jgi:hypothetical protein
MSLAGLKHFGHQEGNLVPGCQHGVENFDTEANGDGRSDSARCSSRGGGSYPIEGSRANGMAISCGPLPRGVASCVFVKRMLGKRRTASRGASTPGVRHYDNVSKQQSSKCPARDSTTRLSFAADTHASVNLSAVETTTIAAPGYVWAMRASWLTAVRTSGQVSNPTYLNNS